MRRLLVATGSVAALSMGAAALAVWRFRRRADPPGARSCSPGNGQGSVRERDIAEKLLLYAVPPAWMAAGFADWICHRATRIETTAGAKESLIHLLMQAEFGIPVLATLFCEVTPPVIGSEIAAYLLHEATVYWDLKYTAPRREISPIEQQIHAYLEVIPLTAIALMAVIHWPETRVLFGRGSSPTGVSLRLRKEPLPAAYIIALLTAVALFNGLPYLEEFWRGWQASGGRLVPKTARQSGVAN